MKKFLGIFGLMFFSLLTKAQVNSNTELKGLINNSFGYYPRLKEAKNQIDIAQENFDLVKTNLPTVDLDGSYTYIRPKVTVPFEVNGEKVNFQFAPVNAYDIHAATSYVVLDFGRLKANIDKAKSDLKFSIDNVTNVQTQLASQVSQIYYSVVYLRKAVAVEDSVLNYLDSNKNIADVKLQNGDAIKLDVLNIQSQIDIETNRKADLLNNLQKEITLLQYTTGDSAVAQSAFDFDVNIQPNASEALATAKTNVEDFILAEDRVAQARSSLAITRVGNNPYLSLGGNVGVKNGYIVPNINTGRFNYAAGASLKIPIYNAKFKKQIAISQSQIKQSQLAQETLNNDYEKNIQQTLTDIQTNTVKIKNMQSQVETATSAEQIASSRYINGIGLNTDITDAAVNTQRVMLTRLQYEYQLCLAKVEYARLTGYKYW